MFDTPLTALVLGGGGARAAYQVGVLKAIAALRKSSERHRARGRNPFGIIVGTSAGAINAASLACGADRFEAAVGMLARVWQDFHCDQVYRTTALDEIYTGNSWLTMLSVGRAMSRWRRDRPRSALDNSPLAGLLARLVPLDQLKMVMAQRHLHGLAITASHYSTGEHVTFYSTSTPVAPWQRSQRVAVPSPITHQHLMASSAIPFIFPPAQITGPEPGWYGDGSMRQTAPLSPAIHLGAERLLIVGVGRLNGPPPQARPNEPPPTLAQIAGHAMASIFLDSLAVDIERMQRINRTLALLPDSVRQDTPLRPLESLVISPSQRIDEIAAKHIGHLPKAVHTLMRNSSDADGDGGTQGAAIASYLLFEAPFTRELIELGLDDTMARADEVRQFFDWDRPTVTLRPPAPTLSQPLPSLSPMPSAPDIELP